MATAKTSAPSNGCWLYPIGRRGNYHFIYKGRKLPVSIENYRRLLFEDGALNEDPRWCVWGNCKKVRPGDEVFIYTGEKNLGIVGYARVAKVGLDTKELTLRFDIKKSRKLSIKPVPASQVRQWVRCPRYAVYNLSLFKAEIYETLPWNHPQNNARDEEVLESQLSKFAGGFAASPELRRRVEKAAINRVTKLYRDKGWIVRSVEKAKCGFDLICIKGANMRNVEVKGVRGWKLGFLMTKREFRNASENKNFVIYVVTGALSKRPKVASWEGKELIRNFNFETILYQARAH